MRFTLVADARTTLQTPGSGSLTEAIAAVYGADVAEAAIAVDAPPANEGEPGVRGIAIEPRLHRASRNYIGVYVNRRWVKNRALTFAIEEAYQGMLPVGRHPIAVLDIAVAPDEVDVNVHPTKAEVRLRREREVFGVLQRAVRRVLSRAGAGADDVGVDLVRLAASPTAPPPLILHSPAMQPRLPDAADAPRDAPADATPMAERLPLLRTVGQVGNMYVIAEGPEGMYLLDQHAAHERVLYERCLAAVRAGRPDVQGLLEPQTLELSAPHRAMIDEHADAFERLGFDIAPFGEAAYVVRTVPAAAGRR